MSLLGTIADVVAGYREYLARYSGAAKLSPLKRFDALMKANEDAAHAEAAVFDFLDLYKLQPRTLEDPSKGGPDFECAYGKLKFAVEVTNIGHPTLTRRSGMGNEPETTYINLPELLRALDSRLSAMASRGQARSYVGPRVLAIVTKHIVAAILPSAGLQEFASTAFLQRRNGTFVPVRRAYSMILLVQITGDASFVAGAVHPNPEHPMPIDPFWRIPFARVTSASSSNDAVVTEWVIAQPDAAKVIYLPSALRRYAKS